MPLLVSQPPTPEVLAACASLDQALASLEEAILSLPSSPYEADVEAVSLFTLVIRHVQGVLAMARSDFSLIPPANTSARAAFETSVREAWMVNADDPFVREARWLAHLQEAESANRRASIRSSSPKSAALFLKEAESIQQFREAVSGVMPKRVPLLMSVPKLPEMIASIGGENLYSLYIYLSQYAHGGHMATDLYRWHLGTQKTFGDFASPNHWYITLRLCWLSISHPANVVLSRIQHASAIYPAAEQEEETVGAIEAVAINSSEAPH